jgi:hypothetical protein
LLPHSTSIIILRLVARFAAQWTKAKSTVGDDVHMDPTKSNIDRGAPVIVVSLPKSGTYLMAELLKTLGCRWTGLHLAERGFSDYRGADILEARHRPHQFARHEPLSMSLTRIQAGEFAVGHLPFNEEVLQATARFKRIYLTRDLRSALVSYMRFLHDTGRLGAEQSLWYSIPDLRKRLLAFLSTTAPYLLARLYKGMTGWSQLDGLTHVRFEDLTSGGERAIRAVDSVATLLGAGAANYDARNSLQSILAAETITKSGRLTRLNEYWSLEAEKRFVEIGGEELNARLGCFKESNEAAASHEHSSRTQAG